MENLLLEVVLQFSTRAIFQEHVQVDIVLVRCVYQTIDSNRIQRGAIPAKALHTYGQPFK